MVIHIIIISSSSSIIIIIMNSSTTTSGAAWSSPASICRKGTSGVSTDGVTAFLLFVLRDLFGTPVNLLLSSQKCQGVPFSPSCQHELITFAAALLLLTPSVRNQIRGRDKCCC